MTTSEAHKGKITRAVENIRPRFTPQSQLSVRLPDYVLEKLRDESRAANVSINALVGEILRIAVDDEVTWSCTPETVE